MLEDHFHGLSMRGSKSDQHYIHVYSLYIVQEQTQSPYGVMVRLSNLRYRCCITTDYLWSVPERPGMRTEKRSRQIIFSSWEILSS